MENFSLPALRGRRMQQPMTLPAKRQRGRPRLLPAGAEPGGVQALDRAVALLGLVAEANGLSLSELAGAASLPPSSTYRLLATLQRHGLVEFDESQQLWHIGAACFRIGSAFLRRRKVADAGREGMQALMERTGETANLAVAGEEGVVFVGQVESHEPIRAFFRPGTISPYHASGAGKAMLAHLPEARVAALVQRHGLPRFTPTTIGDRAALGRALARIRELGFAVDDQERHPGMRCVAAAIFNEFGEAVAGVSVSGPTVRMTPEAVTRIGPLVAEAAAGITRAIGGRQPLAELAEEPEPAPVRVRTARPRA